MVDNYGSSCKILSRNNNANPQKDGAILPRAENRKDCKHVNTSHHDRKNIDGIQEVSGYMELYCGQALLCVKIQNRFEKIKNSETLLLQHIF